MLSVFYSVIRFEVGPLRFEPNGFFLKMMPFLAFCPQETFSCLLRKIPLCTILCNQN
jgi:hypothetical protein